MATPIGNLADLSSRAVRVLRSAEIVACEDTRITGPLLRRLGASGRCVALHAHNEAERSPSLLSAIGRGSRVALVSDAGTPAISDPGARLVAAAQAEGLTVVPIPGPSAVTTAISVAALADGRFHFEGFLPSRSGQRRSRLLDLAASPVAVVLFEAPHRIAALAADLAGIIEPARVVTVARELTKRFEQIVRLTVAELGPWLDADPNHRRGEFVLVLHPAAPAGASRSAGPSRAGGASSLVGASGPSDGSGASGSSGGSGASASVGGSGGTDESVAAETAGGAGAEDGTAGEPAAPPEQPSALGRKALAILAESLPPRAAARAAARISGDDADLLYRFRAGLRSRGDDR